MRMLTAARGAVPGLAPGKPNVEYVAMDGTLHAVPLADAARVRLTDMQPSRRFRARKGQRHLPGRWWSATDGRHVGYESWLERDHLMWLDFDQAVTGIASQPFWLFWTAEEGKARSHAPDYFAAPRWTARRWWSTAVRWTGAAARDLAAFEATRQACDLVGWEYRLVGAPDPVADGEPAVAGGVPASSPRHPGAGCGAAGRVRCSCSADGRGGGGGRPDRGAAGAVPPAVAARAGG